jgi:hypothetical protein
MQCILAPLYVYYLRYNEAIILWIEEVQLQRVADAARPMNWCNVCHVEIRGRVQPCEHTKWEVDVVLHSRLSGSRLLGAIPSLSP